MALKQTDGNTEVKWSNLQQVNAEQTGEAVDMFNFACFCGGQRRSFAKVALHAKLCDLLLICRLSVPR